MRPTVSALLVLAACASGAPPSPAVSPPPPSPDATPTTPPAPSASAAAPTPVLSPGVVLIGDIIGPPQFDPKPALTGLKPQLLRCYSDARLLTPSLHGKLSLRIQVSESGLVTLVAAMPGGTANDPGLVACIGDAAKTASFPKPGGTAIITVPLVFRP